MISARIVRTVPDGPGRSVGPGTVRPSAEPPFRGSRGVPSRTILPDPCGWGRL
jgi:hypothetical protein